MKEELKDNFAGIGTPLTALSIFYAILIQIIAIPYDAPPFWRYALIFSLLLFTFFFSLAIYTETQKKTDAVRLAGLFILGL